ncbi:MAG: hypothetical protein J6S14_15220 [Clostridia bacterium]|nr:hypothetical protein [Clostridia bacterium]
MNERDTLLNAAIASYDTPISCAKIGIGWDVSDAVSSIASCENADISRDTDRELTPETIHVHEMLMSGAGTRSVCEIYLNEEDTAKLLRYARSKQDRIHVNNPFTVYLSANMKSAPVITDVKSFYNKTTVVFFADGTKEHAVCSDDDTYSIEAGITFCLIKKMLGSENYKKIVNSAAKAYRQKLKDAEEAKKKKKEEHEERMRQERREAAARREAEEREKERQIEILAEAIRRAAQKDEEVSECPSEE